MNTKLIKNSLSMLAVASVVAALLPNLTLAAVVSGTWDSNTEASGGNPAYQQYQHVDLQGTQLSRVISQSNSTVSAPTILMNQVCQTPGVSWTLVSPPTNVDHTYTKTGAYGQPWSGDFYCNAPTPPPPTFVDVGLRVNEGTPTVPVITHIAMEALPGTSPLVIQTNSGPYHVALVAVGDANASGVVIQTSSGPMALRICATWNGCTPTNP